MMISMKELIIIGTVLLAIVLTSIITAAVSSGKKKRAIREAEREANVYCDLYYAQAAKIAETKYKAFAAKGYLDRLPYPVEAIAKDRELQDQLDMADTAADKKNILGKYVPEILLSLVRCREEKPELAKKDAAQMKRLMREYNLMSN